MEDGLAVVLDPSSLARVGSLEAGQPLEMHVVLTDVGGDGMNAVQFALDVDPRLLVYEQEFPSDASINFEVGPREYAVGFLECTDFRFVPKVVMSFKVLATDPSALSDLRVGLKDLTSYGERMLLTRCDEGRTLEPLHDLGGVLLNPTNEDVVFFGSVPEVVVQGQPFELAWVSTGLAQLEEDPSSSTSGVQTVTATPGDTFELLEAGSGDVLETFAPDVITTPRINTFTGELVPGSMPPQVRCRWDIDGASSVYLNGRGPLSPIGALQTDLTGTTLRLMASNGFGSTTETIEIDTDSLPAVIQFTAEPLRFAPGSPVTLTWVAFDADAASIQPGVGTVDPVSGSIDVFPTQETTYTLTLTNDLGSVSRDVVVAPSPPTIQVFNVSAASVFYGQSVTVEWLVEAADQVRIEPGAIVVDPRLGTAEVPVDSTTTEISLIASNALDEVVARRAIDVTVPRIESFTASPDSVRYREPLTLAWSVTPGVELRIDPEPGPVVNPNASTTVVVGAQDQIYTLTMTSGEYVQTATVGPIHVFLPEVQLRETYPEFPPTPAIGRTFTQQGSCIGCETLRLDPVPGDFITLDYLSDPYDADFGASIVLADTIQLIATATNPAGSVQDTLLVEPAAFVPSVSLSTTTPTVYPGRFALVRADVTLASSVTLQPGDIDVPIGTWTVFPIAIEEPTVFMLTGVSPVGTDESTLEIGTKVPDVAFVRPSSVLPGQPFTLRVDVYGADEASIDPPIDGFTNDGGYVTTTIDSTTTWTVTATNAAGTRVASTQVIARVPVISDFLSDAEGPLVPGESTRLFWDTNGGADISIETRIDGEFGAVVADSLPAVGALDVFPTSTTTYRLVARNPSGFAASSLVVDVDPMRIDVFEVSQSSVSPGTILVLRWDVAGEGEVELEGTGIVALSGQINVAPQQTTTYRLNARSGGVVVDTATARVVVREIGEDLIRWSWSEDGDDGNAIYPQPFVPFDTYLVLEGATSDLRVWQAGVDVPSDVILLAQSYFGTAPLNVGTPSDLIVGLQACLDPEPVQPLVVFTWLTIRTLDGTRDFLGVRDLLMPAEPAIYQTCADVIVPLELGLPLALGYADPTPVLSEVSLRAAGQQDGVELAWDVPGGCPTRVHVIRRVGASDPQLITTLAGPDACRPWTAPAVTSEDTWWRVAVETADGRFHSPEVQAEMAPAAERLPTRDTLLPNAPNPFNPSTDLRFALARACRVKLEIFDTAGRRVRTFDLGVQPSGEGAVTWRGRDQQGHVVSSGVYLVRMTTEGRVDARRILLMK